MREDDTVACGFCLEWTMRQSHQDKGRGGRFGESIDKIGSKMSSLEKTLMLDYHQKCISTLFLLGPGVFCFHNLPQSTITIISYPDTKMTALLAGLSAFILLPIHM